MRDLTVPEIAAILTKYPKAKKIAVENFLMTVGNNTNERYARMNLGEDARVYKWNTQTVSAIKKGIDLAAK